MILYHISQSACRLIERSPVSYAKRLGCCDLDIIDIVFVPDWTEESISEAECEQILDAIFGDVVVDAVYRLFREYCFDLRFEMTSRYEISAKWLLEYDPYMRELQEKSGNMMEKWYEKCSCDREIDHDLCIVSAFLLDHSE